MSIAPQDIPLSNYITEAADKLSTPSVVIRSDGTPQATHIELTDGTKLGLIQSIHWEMGVGAGRASCVIETIATPGEFKALAEHTGVAVRPAFGYHPLRYLWDWYAYKVWAWFTKPFKTTSA